MRGALQFGILDQCPPSSSVLEVEKEGTYQIVFIALIADMNSVKRHKPWESCCVTLYYKQPSTYSTTVLHPSEMPFFFGSSGVHCSFVLTFAGVGWGVGGRGVGSINGKVTSVHRS